jgi:hypothetical protein
MENDKTMIPNFTGEPNQGAREWLETFEDYAKFKSYNPDTRLSYLKLKMTGMAKDWLGTLPAATKNDANELMTAFQERFETTEITKHKLMRDLFAIKQQAGESVDSYLAKLSRTARLCGLSDDLIMNAATLGLRPPIASFVLESKPDTMKDIYKYARIAEVTRQPNTDPIDVLNAQMEKLTQTIGDMSSKMSQMTTAAVSNATAMEKPAPQRNDQPRPGTQYRPRQYNGPPQSQNTEFNQYTQGWNRPPHVPSNVPENNIQYQHPQSAPMQSAPQMQMSYPPTNPTQYPPRQCYNCYGFGHIARNCTQPPRQH